MNLPPLPSRSLLWLLVLLTGLGEISTQLLIPSLASIEVELGAPKGSVLAALAVFVGAFGLGQLILGPLSDRIGRRPVLLGGLSLYVLATLWMAFANGMQEFIAARALQGLGACAALVLARAVVRDVWKERAAPTLALTVIGMLCAIVLMPVIGGLLATHLGGWRSAVGLSALLGSLALLAVMLGYRESNLSRDPQAGRIGSLVGQYASLLAGRSYRAFALALACTYGAMFCFIAGSSWIFVGLLGLTATQYGLVFGGIVSGLIAGALCASRWITRIGAERLVGIGTGLVATGALVTLLVHQVHGLSILGLFVPQVLLTFGAGMVLPASVAGAVMPNAQCAGLAAGFMGFAQMAGGMSAGLLLSQLQDGTALPMIELHGVFACGAFILFQLLRPRNPLLVPTAPLKGR
ncbi:MFS transporter [Pseudomonas sp. LS44]|uniref:MFS transporter n=1 Tax=Pseudomonas sp. LS44 TaxID=1357074 RepID=UPI00215AB7A2|nr:MFS transporter [Pseudomonas sp. LS44]UVE19728.1 MFS transporter [Pseudomonas sp. LS44]